MTLLRIRVELPTHNHRFNVIASTQETVHELKAEIERACRGGPRIDAQRVIWRGRILRDEERISDIWSDNDDLTTIHLSVRPGGWTHAPPNSPEEDALQPPPASEPKPSPPPAAAEAPAPAPSSVPPAALPTAPSRPTSVAVPRSQTELLLPTLNRAPPLPHEQSATIASAPPHIPTFQGAPPSASAAVYAPPVESNLQHGRPPLALPRPAVTTVCLGYITHLHQTAIHALATGHNFGYHTPHDPEAARNYAIRHLNALGWSWPEIFDRSYPPISQEPVTVKYESTLIEGQYYMRLVQAGTPTPVQAHALHVLKHTFPLLFVPAVPVQVPMPGSAAATPPTVPANDVHVLNQRLRELGQPPVRVRGADRVIVWELNLRPLVVPLLSHCLRTVILLWLFFPAASRQPIIAVLIMGWFFYETWKTVRSAFVRLIPDPRPAGVAAPQPVAAAGQQQQPRHGPAAAVPVPPPHAAGQQGPHPVAGPAGGHANVHAGVPQNAQYSEIVLNSLSRMNLQEERAALDGRAPGAPSQRWRIWSFFSLMVLTAYPAYWDRRRALLKQREGMIRTELRARNALDEPLPETAGEDNETVRRANEARQRARAEVMAAHERRPAWVRDYVERVARDEWVDE